MTYLPPTPILDVVFRIITLMLIVLSFSGSIAFSILFLKNRNNKEHKIFYKLWMTRSITLISVLLVFVFMDPYFFDLADYFYNSYKVFLDHLYFSHAAMAVAIILVEKYIFLKKSYKADMYIKIVKTYLIICLIIFLLDAIGIDINDALREIIPGNSVPDECFGKNSGCT